MPGKRSPALPIRSFPAGQDQSVQRFHTGFFRHGWTRAVILGIIIAAAVAGLGRLDLLRRFELYTVDARFRLRGAAAVSSPLAVVFIGDDSLEEFGRWPWSWEYHALLIDALKRAGARSILFDIFFIEPPSEAQARFLGAVARQAGNVYFCSFLTGFSLDRGGGVPLVAGEELILPSGPLQEGAAGTGHCVALPDMDGSTRRVPLFMRHAGELVPAALIRLALDILAVPLDTVVFSKGAFELRPPGRPPVRIPVDAEGQTPVNFTGGLDAFPAYSFRQVLQADRFPEKAAIDLGEFRDKIVLVGVTYTGNTDLRPTPFSSAYPMIGIQATLLDNILAGNFVRRAGPAVETLLWLFVGALMGWCAFSFRPLVSLVLSGVAGAVYLGVTVEAFNRWHLQMRLVVPLLTILLVYLAVTTMEYVEARRQKLRYLERMKYMGHLVESSTEAIVSFDTDGSVVTWNHGAQEIYGYREWEVIGREWTLLAPAEAQETLDRRFREALREEAEMKSEEMVFVARDGRPIPVSVSASPIRDSRGAVVGLSAISQDLSEKKRMIEMLVQSEKLAEIGRLGSGIVHEIKNPLTSIMMMSSIIISTEGLSEKTVKYADIIEKESQRILRLSQNILSLARPKKAERRPLDINGAITDLLDLVEYEVKKAKVSMRTGLPETVPEVLGDAEKLKQVLLNVVMNAVHALGTGGSISIETAPPGGEPAIRAVAGEWLRREEGVVDPAALVSVSVGDSGPGIPPGVFEQIFEPFFTTKGEGKGTGLGLYISRNIIAEHRGGIEVLSREGAGTVFTIFLPTAGEAGKRDDGKPAG